jgi:hypothetical protein
VRRFPRRSAACARARLALSPFMREAFASREVALIFVGSFVGMFVRVGIEHFDMHHRRKGRVIHLSEVENRHLHFVLPF